LRFLQEGTVRPVGSYEEVPVDVRVVAATHVHLAEAVERGEFREDLYYRLNVLRVALPPVRERREDARLLLAHFIRRCALRYKREVPAVGESFWQAFDGHPLPGNVRQLQSLAERIVVSGRRQPLRAADLPRLLEGHAGRRSSSVPAQGAAVEAAPANGSVPAPAAERVEVLSIDLSAKLADNIGTAVRAVERAYLTQVLERTHGRIADAATLAGISRRTLHRKLLELGLDKKQFRMHQD